MRLVTVSTYGEAMTITLTAMGHHHKYFGYDPWYYGADFGMGPGQPMRGYDGGYNGFHPQGLGDPTGMKEEGAAEEVVEEWNGGGEDGREELED